MSNEEKNISYYKGGELKNVSADYVKKEIAQFLKIDNLNFLLGSGCSSHKDNGKEVGIPTMRELYKDFFVTHKDFRIADIEVEGLYDMNLEKLLEVLGAISVVNSTKEVDIKVDDKIRLVQEYIRSRIKEGTFNKMVTDIYKKFYLKTVSNGRKNPINIFTTNYDLYNEMALDLLSFPYNNGFVGTYKRIFNPASYKFAYVEDMNLTKGIWERVPNFYNLYKIHGSITWVKEQKNNNDNNYIIKEVDPNTIGESDVAMIYPTPLKDRTTLMTPYSDLFRVMEFALLKKNSVLITIGYSFSDEHINRIILNSLSIPTFKLIIFGRDSKNDEKDKSGPIERIIKEDNHRIIVINSQENIHYFKNIVDLILPDVYDNVDEMVAQTTDLEINRIEGTSNE